MAHRALTSHQKAAHILMPMAAALVGEMRTEADTAELEAKRARGNADTKADWAEIALRARARAEGAGRLLELLKVIARG
jgi:hypothetical protein